MQSPLVSIIITNHNYGRFLKECIDSALDQTYPQIEVIVVDDGSTDYSPEVIALFGNRIVPILKENGGQNSAVNAGYARSRGEVVLFLDADDTLLPKAAELAVLHFEDPGVVQVHWPLWDIDQHGTRTGHVRPRHDLPQGDLRPLVMRDGPDSYVTSPTTGNAWARSFLQDVLPIPPMADPTWADAYLFGLSPLFGAVKRLEEPHGCYRLHGKNYYATMPLEQRLAVDLLRYEHRCDVVAKHCRSMGLDVNPESWKKHSWLHRLDQAIRDIEASIPAGCPFVLADEDEWATEGLVAGRPCLPFPERDGQYWGRPASDEDALWELDRQRQAGANYIVFGWPAFWWLDHYRRLGQRLRTGYRTLLDNDQVVAFDLRESSADYH
jgi:glycosyltransferase involved in cell wall biosynthesis